MIDIPAAAGMNEDPRHDRHHTSEGHRAAGAPRGEACLGAVAAHDHGGVDRHPGDQRKILQYKRNIAESFSDGGEVALDLRIGPQARGRRHHDPHRAGRHGILRQRLHPGEARLADAGHHRHGCACRHTCDHRAALLARKLARLAHDPEDRQARGAFLEIEVGHTVDAREVERPLGSEGRDGNGEDAGGGFVEHGAHLPSLGGFPDGDRSAAQDAAHRPGRGRHLPAPPRGTAQAAGGRGERAPYSRRIAWL